MVVGGGMDGRDGLKKESLAAGEGLLIRTWASRGRLIKSC
jgi:hypothetical protein